MSAKIKIKLFLFITLCIPNFIYSQTNPPGAPIAPVAPVVPGTGQNRRIGEIPPPPPLPNRENQSNEAVTVIDSYDLTVLGAYPNGNTSNNTANTINNASYVLYSNRNMEIRLSFNDGTNYIYHLRNPRSLLEINNGLFREIFDTLVQIGNQLLLDQYTCELTYNENTITSFSLLGNNRVIVLLTLRKK